MFRGQNGQSNLKGKELLKNSSTTQYHCSYISRKETAHEDTLSQTICVNTMVYKRTFNISQVKAFILRCWSLGQCVHPSKQSMISFCLSLSLAIGERTGVYVHMRLFGVHMFVSVRPRSSVSLCQQSTRKYIRRKHGLERRKQWRAEENRGKATQEIRQKGGNNKAGGVGGSRRGGKGRMVSSRDGWQERRWWGKEGEVT